jgi:hypothetical protein
MASRSKVKLPPIREVGLEEGRELLEAEARRYLSIGADEFIRKWYAGEFGDPDETNPDVWNVVTMLPFIGMEGKQ